MVIGLDSAPDAGPLRTTVTVLAGTWIGAHLIMLNIRAFASFATRAWMQIDVRVLGSWTLASVLPVLALVFKRQ